MIPGFVAQWLGKPYADKGRGPAYDCWGLARAVLMAECGVTLPDYADAYRTASDMRSVGRAVRAGLASGWQPAERPQVLDLLVIHIAGRPWHCGLMVNASQFLHVPPPGRGGVQQLSCIERLDSPYWSARQKEFWRYV